MGDQMLVPTIALLAGAILVTAVGRRDGDDPAPRAHSGDGLRPRAPPPSAWSSPWSRWPRAGYADVPIGHSGAKAVGDETGKEGQELGQRARGREAGTTAWGRRRRSRRRRSAFRRSPQ